MEIIIEVKHLCKIYNSKVTAVNNVNLLIEKGKFYAIMGHSGSGKTTLLNLLGLLDDPTSGEILIDGKQSLKLNGEQKRVLSLL